MSVPKARRGNAVAFAVSECAILFWNNYIYEIMTKPIFTIRGDRVDHHVAQLFVNLKLRRVPVSDADGKRGGMLTLSDRVLGICERG